MKNYTYNSANRLVQVSDQLSVTSLSYNGLGQRLSMDAAGVIATYVLDGDRPLTATSNGNTTFYLYGLGGIGEETNAWSYSLPDGTNTPRQLTNSVGEITLAGRYTPWGDSLDYAGTGNFTFGYFGGLMDSATGLLYVGNGQYYDPATGRFLTRDVNPNSPNPYVPWGDPTGALLAPLALVGLIYGRKKKKSKFDYFVIVLFVAVGMSMGLSACAPSSLPVPPNAPTLPQPIVTVVTMTPNAVSTSTVVPTNTSQCPSPDIINYDPTVAPACISWSPSVDIPLSPAIPINFANAQYFPGFGGNLCGQVSLSMIAAMTSGDILRDIWVATGETRSPTDAYSLLYAAVTTFAGNWAGKAYYYNQSYSLTREQALTIEKNPDGTLSTGWYLQAGDFKSESWSGETYGTNAAQALRSRLAQNHYLGLAEK